MINQCNMNRKTVFPVFPSLFLIATLVLAGTLGPGSIAAAQDNAPEVAFSLPLKSTANPALVFQARGELKFNPESPMAYRNDGVDISGIAGSPVHAAAAGMVKEAGRDMRLGFYVILSHDNGYETRYYHLDSYRVTDGDKVEKEETIGKLGNSGIATDMRLHFQIWKNDQALDPVKLAPGLAKGSPAVETGQEEAFVPKEVPLADTTQEKEEIEFAPGTGREVYSVVADPKTGGAFLVPGAGEDRLDASTHIVIPEDEVRQNVSQASRFFDNVKETLETMLYGQKGRDATNKAGRRMWMEEFTDGVQQITIVDTPEHIEEVRKYIASLPQVEGSRREEILFPKNTDVEDDDTIGNLRILLRRPRGSIETPARGTARVFSMAKGSRASFGNARFLLRGIYNNDDDDPDDDSCDLIVNTPSQSVQIRLEEYGVAEFVGDYRFEARRVDPRRDNDGTAQIRVSYQ
ncbi:MAG: M23 family metallopeptidase [Candidatus Sumerlaeia bacterium]